jgi:predicted nucleic acid-binding protein
MPLDQPPSSTRPFSRTFRPTLAILEDAHWIDPTTHELFRQIVARVRATQLARYADLDIDLADAALIWLAQLVGEYEILTVDERDFAASRLAGRRRFRLIHWYRG